MQMELLRTYNACGTQIFRKLRWPAAIPYLFPALKVAMALAITGAIVGELPTGAQAGLGARLLIASYNGLMLLMWATLVVASLPPAGGRGADPGRAGAAALRARNERLSGLVAVVAALAALIAHGGRRHCDAAPWAASSPWSARSAAIIALSALAEGPGRRAVVLTPACSRCWSCSCGRC